MGFFSKLFGDDSARKSVEAQNKETLDFIKQTSGQARADARELFDRSLAARQAGNEQALALLAGVIPERMRLIQEGRAREQDTRLAGSELYKRAILGLPTDMSILSKSPMEVSTDFASTRLPSTVAKEAFDEASGATDASGMPRPGTPEFYQWLINQIGGVGGSPFGGTFRAAPQNTNTNMTPGGILPNMRGFA